MKISKETWKEDVYKRQIEGCPSADTDVSEDAEEAAFVVLVLLFKWIFSPAVQTRTLPPPCTRCV